MRRHPRWVDETFWAGIEARVRILLLRAAAEQLSESRRKRDEAVEDELWDTLQDTSPHG